MIAREPWFKGSQIWFQEHSVHILHLTSTVTDTSISVCLIREHVFAVRSYDIPLCGQPSVK